MPAYAAYLEPSVPGLGELLGNVSAASAETFVPRTAPEAYLMALLWGMLHVSGVLRSLLPCSLREFGRPFRLDSAVHMGHYLGEADISVLYARTRFRGAIF